MENTKYMVQPSRLNGIVKLDGAKNSGLRLLAASLLTEQDIKLNNFPTGISDARIHIDMLNQLGKSCIVDENTIRITQPEKIKSVLDWKGRSIRNTLLILGALVASTGQGAVPLPGGCQIGERKFDLHEMILRKMGCGVWLEDNFIYAKVKNRLKGTEIYLPIRSTGATENAIICATLAEGKTKIWNPHIRPEIIDLVRFLNKMGAQIKVFGQEHIEVRGVSELGGVEHTVIPDNMEAITWLIASVITNGDIEIINFPFDHLEVPLIFLRESGVKFYRGDNSLIVRGGRCYPIDISTGPYPGINSDMQPLFAIYGFCASGTSRIVDLRFPGRYQYANEIGKMGGHYEIQGDFLVISGGKPLKGAHVNATDLRAGAALVLAGLTAKGETVISNAWQIERGYNNFLEKITALEGKVTRIS